MPRFTEIQTNFTAGETSPRLRGRVDVSRYYNSVAVMENFLPMVHGGARRRGGMAKVQEVADSARFHKLIRFVFNRAQTYQLEFGHLTLRFYNVQTRAIIESSPGVPLVVATPYTEDDLDDLRFTQLFDTMFITHPGYFPRMLTRLAVDSWKLVVAPFTVEPSAEQGEIPNTTLTLSAATVGAGRTLTAGANAFQPGDVGRDVEQGAGRATITGYTSATQVTATVVDAFSGVGPHAAGSWNITLSPQQTLTPSGTITEGGAVTLTLGAGGWKNDAQVSHLNNYVMVNDGMVQITGYTSATIVTGIARTALSSTAAASPNAWTLEQKVWSAANGYPKASTIYEQRLYAAGSDQYPQDIWGTRTGDFFNFALGADGSDGLSFRIAAEDASPLEHLASSSDLLPLTMAAEFRMVGGDNSPITPTNVRIKPQSFYGANFVRPVRVGNEVVFVSRSGRKVRALSDRLTADAGSGLAALDLTLLAEHITGDDGLVDLTYQQDPDPLLWAARDDGISVACAYSREHEVIGWCRNPTKGSVEVMSAVPNGARDETWVITRRNINGVYKRYVEVYDDEYHTDCAIKGAVASVAVTNAVWAAGVLTVTVVAHGRATGDRCKLEEFLSDDIFDEEGRRDAFNITRSITVTGANTFTMNLTDNPGTVYALGVARFATDTWGGLSYMIGETLTVVGDDAQLGDESPDGAGNVVLDRPAFDVEFGLSFNAKLVMLPFEERQLGTAQGRQVSVYEIVARVHETRGLRIDGQEIPFMHHGTEVHDQVPAPFTGDKTIERTVWEKSGGAITIEAPYPTKAQVLAVIRKAMVTD